MGIIAALVKNHETQEALRDGIAEIERLTRERDEAQERFEDMRDVVYNTANVERDHLRAALQKVLAASVPAGYDAGYAVTEAIAREALSGEHQQVETTAPPVAWCVEASHDGSLSPPVAFRQDAVLHQQNMREQHPGITWTLVPLYRRSAVETSDFQVCLKGPGQCIRPAGHAGECDQVKARGEHD